MFCPQCGTQVTNSKARFCRECGGEIDAASGQRDRATAGATQGSAGPASGASSNVPPFQRPCMLTHVMVKESWLKPLLMAAGLLVLLPLALALLFGALVASLFAGIALIHVVFKLAPLLLIGVVLYWFMTRRRRTSQPGSGRYGTSHQSI